jgi:hypothetical protein
MIQNNVANTAICFAKGNEILSTSTGQTYINSGTTSTYNIKVTRNPDGSYPETQLVNGYKIGTTLLMEDFPEYVFETDYIYTVRVTGSNAATLVIGEIQETGKMNLDDWFN